MMDSASIAELIEQGLPGATARVASEDNTHFEAVIVAEAFEGKRSVARHQMVYAALGSSMGNEIHALSFRTFTPAEWQAQGA